MPNIKDIDIRVKRTDALSNDELEMVHQLLTDQLQLLYQITRYLLQRQQMFQLLEHLQLKTTVQQL